MRIYGGLYELDKDSLQRVREHISANLKTFAKLINQPGFKKKFGPIRGEQNKRIPPEFKVVAEKQPLIYNKNFYYYAKLDIKKILGKKLPDIVMGYYFAGKPVSVFFRKALDG